jgi:hypothetical protein
MTKREEATVVLATCSDSIALLRGIRLAREWEESEKLPTDVATQSLPRLLFLCGFAPSSAVDAPPVRSQLYWDIVSGVEIIRSLHGFAITDAQILDRAANIVAGLIGNYKITPL